MYILLKMALQIFHFNIFKMPQSRSIKFDTSSYKMNLLQPDFQYRFCGILITFELTLKKVLFFVGFYGILVVIIVCSVQIYTAILLTRSWVIAEDIFPAIQRKNRYPYAALTEITYGRKSASLVTFLLDLTIFSAGIPNLIVGLYFYIFMKNNKKFIVCETKWRSYT